MIVRSVKAALVALIGLFGLLTGIDNILDYPVNFAAVQHVMAMDTIHPGSAFMWRSVTSFDFHRYAYGLIIATELLYGTICLVGALVLLRNTRRGATFEPAKRTAIFGLGLGFALYFFGFLTIGGEWFQMWQSPQWNMQQAAFRFLVAIGLVLIFVASPEAE